MLRKHKNMKKIFIKNEFKKDLNKRLIDLLNSQNYTPVIIPELDVEFNVNSEWISIDIVRKKYSNQIPTLKNINLDHGSLIRYINSKNESKIGMIKTPSFEIEANNVYVQSLTSDNMFPVRINRIVSNVEKLGHKYDDIKTDDYVYDTYLLLSYDFKDLEKQLSFDITKPLTAFKDAFGKYYDKTNICLGQLIDTEKYNNLFLDGIEVDSKTNMPYLTIDAMAFFDVLSTYDFSNVFNSLFKNELSLYNPISSRKANVELSELYKDDISREQKMFKTELFTNYTLIDNITLDDIEFIENLNDTVMSADDICSKIKTDLMAQSMLKRKIDTISSVKICLKNTNKIKVNPISDYLDYTTDEITENNRDQYELYDLSNEDLRKVYQSINVLFEKERVAEIIKIAHSNDLKNIKTQTLLSLFKANIDSILTNRLKPTFDRDLAYDDDKVNEPVVAEIKGGDFYIKSKDFLYTKAFAMWCEKTFGIKQYSIALNRLLPIWINMDNKTFRSSKPVYGDVLHDLDTDLEVAINSIVDGYDIENAKHEITNIVNEISKDEVGGFLESIGLGNVADGLIDINKLNERLQSDDTQSDEQDTKLEEIYGNNTGKYDIELDSSDEEKVIVLIGHPDSLDIKHSTELCYITDDYISYQIVNRSGKIFNDYTECDGFVYSTSLTEFHKSIKNNGLDLDCGIDFTIVKFKGSINLRCVDKDGTEVFFKNDEMFLYDYSDIDNVQLVIPDDATVQKVDEKYIENLSSKNLVIKNIKDMFENNKK